MTYRRDPQTFAGAMTRALRAGQDWLGEQLGVSTSRLRQCANPIRSDSLPLHLACAADIACSRAGFGTPLFDEYRRRLIETGAIRPMDRAAAIEAEVSVMRKTLQAAADLILGGLRPQEVAA